MSEGKKDSQEEKPQEEKPEEKEQEVSTPTHSGPAKKPKPEEKAPAAVAKKPRMVPLDPLWPECGDVPEGESLG